jgi:hypothetical protein
MLRFYDFALLFPSLDLNQADYFYLFHVDLRICPSSFFFRGKSGKIIFTFDILLDCEDYFVALVYPSDGRKIYEVFLSFTYNYRFAI